MPACSEIPQTNQILLRTGFLPIIHNINFGSQKIIKGKKLVESYHVQRVEELSGFDSGNKLIRASVIRTTNVSEKPYNVKVEIFGPKRYVKQVSCTCIAQASKKCKHIYALIYYINTYKSETKTSLEQQWGKPSDSQLGKDQYSYVPPVSERFKEKQISKLIGKVPVHDDNYMDLKDIDCPLRKSKKAEHDGYEFAVAKSVVNDLLDSVEEELAQSTREACVETLVILSKTSIDIVPQNLQIKDPLIQKFYDNNIYMNEENVIKICYETVPQYKCKKWFEVREVRISASTRAHKIKTRTKKSESALIDQLFNSVDLNNVDAIQYGRNNENNALNDYCMKFKYQISQIGAFVMPSQPWFCASPDALVIVDDCVTKCVEIKCPFSCSKKPVYDNITKQYNVQYLYRNMNEDVCLKESYIYFTQCQMTMYVTGLLECDLFVWSPMGSCLVTIPIDNQFLQKVIPKLTKFYFQYLLPAVYFKQSAVSNKENNNENNNSINI